LGVLVEAWESIVVSITPTPVIATRVEVIAPSAVIIDGPVAVDEDRIIPVVIAGRSAVDTDI
jgi:hypothetical protein